MNPYKKPSIFGLVTILMVLVLFLSACMTESEFGLETTPGDDVGVSEEGNNRFAGFANGQQGWITASTLLDYDLTNMNGESMGEIEDLLVNMSTGEIPYATIEYGGFLDIGDRQVAVPLNALNWNAVGQLGLTIEEDQLANYPDLGDGWPNTSDPTWDDNLFDFWNEQGVDPGINVEDTSGHTMWVSSLLDTGLQDIGFGGGTVSDLLIDPQQGRAHYAIVRYEPGIFENELVAVPVSAFNWQAYQGDELAFAEGIDQNVIEQAPTFAPDVFSGDLLDPSWDDEFAGFWSELGFDTAAMTAGAAAGATTETDTTTMTGATDMTGMGGIANAQDVMLRATTLLDYDFENIDGEVSGEIEDIILDAATGRILYVTLEYGGFLDIGDTELPVPLSAFVRGTDGELVLNFEEERLQEFPDLGDDWPNVDTDTWDDDANNFWRNIGIEPGYDVTTASNSIMRASDIVGYPVGDVGYGAGAVQDLVIDVGKNQAKYVIVTYGAGALYDENLVAVPFSAFDAGGFGNQLVFADTMDPTILDEAPRFDNNLYTGPGPLDPAWDDEFDSFWEERGYTLENRTE
jgi:sporulation protein YlmC with PRC-barrel domain